MENKKEPETDKKIIIGLNELPSGMICDGDVCRLVRPVKGETEESKDELSN